MVTTATTTTMLWEIIRSLHRRGAIRGFRRSIRVVAVGALVAFFSARGVIIVALFFGWARRGTCAWSLATVLAFVSAGTGRDGECRLREVVVLLVSLADHLGPWRYCRSAGCRTI